MSYNKRGQYSTEYLIIIGIGIGIIASFLVYVTLFYGAFAVGSSANQITSVANSFVKEANYVVSQGPGSMQSFPITIPLLQPHDSFFCGDTIKLQTTTELGISQAYANISGILPLSSGTYDAFAKNINNTIEIGLLFSISSISQSYSVSGNTLSYTLSFYNISNSLTAASFNISLFSTNGVYFTSASQSTTTGTYSGTLTLPSSSGEYIVEIYPNNSGDYASTCIAA